MKKFREIIRFVETSELSQRQIAGALKVSRPVVADTIRKIKSSGITFDEIMGFSDTALQELLSEGKITKNKIIQLQELFPYIAKELKKKGGYPAIALERIPGEES